MKKKISLKRFYNAVHNDLLVGTLSLVILSTVDLIGLNAFFLSIAVDWLTRAQFFALSFVAVFFKVVARTKRQNIAWFFWMVITFFGGFMFIINTVVIQGDDTKPEYVIRANEDYQEAKQKTADLLFDQSEYRKKNQRKLATELDGSITLARAYENEMSTALAIAETQLKNEPKHEIKALDIFARIPYIFTRPSWALTIAAIFFVILYASIEASIFSIAGEIGKPVEKKPKEPIPSKVKPMIVDESFDDVTAAEYKAIAEYPDGSVKLPEQAAKELRISTEEAEQFHAKLYAGYIYRDEKYVKIGGVK